MNKANRLKIIPILIMVMALMAQSALAMDSIIPDSMREIAVQQGKTAQKSGFDADLGPFVNAPLLHKTAELPVTVAGMRGAMRAVVGGRNFSAADVDNAMIPFTTSNGYGLSNLFHDGGEWPGTNGNPSADDGASSFGTDQAAEIYDFDGNRHYPKAVLRYIGTHCYIFVPVMFFPTLPRSLSSSEDATPPAQAAWGMYWPDTIGMSNGPYYFAPDANGTVLEPRYVLGADKNYARLKLKEMADQFDAVIYTKIREHFGSEADIDGDPKIFIMLDDIRDGSGSFRGYFWAGNQFPRTSISLSNEKELVNIDLFPSFVLAQADTYGTLAHEFTHMVIYNENYKVENGSLVGMQRWLEEALTQYAQHLYDGKFSTNLDEFIKKPDTILAEDRINDVWLGPRPYANYGASFLWMYYLVEKYGGSNLPGFLKAIVRNQDGGMGSIDAVLKTFSTDSKAVFNDWVVANYLDKTRKRDGSLLNDGKWGYSVDNDFNESNNVGKYERLPVKFSEKVILTEDVTARSSNVSPWAADYIEISGNTGNLNLAFDGDDAGQFRAAVIKRGKDIDPAVDLIYLNDRQSGNTIIQNYGYNNAYENLVLVPMVVQNNNYQKLSYVYSASFDDLKVAIFPNPTFENQLHILVRTEKQFSSEPRLQMTFEGEQGYLTMTPINDSTYMANYTLKTSGEGVIVANGTNADGVILSNQLKFSAVYYPPNSQGLLSASFVTLHVPAGSLRAGGTVIVAAPENPVSYAGINRISHNVDLALPVEKAEKAIEISIPLNSPTKTDDKRAGLYRTTTSGHKWIGPVTVADGKASGQIDFSGSVFVAIDELAPVIVSQAVAHASGWTVITADDLGSGIDASSAKVVCGGRSLPLRVTADGAILADTTSLREGACELSVEIADHAGNSAIANVRAEISAPNALAQVITYPNPARTSATLRASFTGPANGSAQVSVKILDVSGHKVTDLQLQHRGGGIYEARWDLANSRGKQVANGVYYAEFNAGLAGQTAKERRKIAVLR
ncbi:MAG TPA: hypothetical protein PLM07_07540 [Candidatus Rifleibacterium sp.]|nr:hypothetical protein [Candidatus Rifleibacterium sp.]HPT45737.1 hypothetical protein [Candidatus Rifleibacterium sp.]